MIHCNSLLAKHQNARKIYSHHSPIKSGKKRKIIWFNFESFEQLIWKRVLSFSIIIQNTNISDTKKMKMRINVKNYQMREIESTQTKLIKKLRNKTSKIKSITSSKISNMHYIRVTWDHTTIFHTDFNFIGGGNIKTWINDVMMVLFLYRW